MKAILLHNVKDLESEDFFMGHEEFMNFCDHIGKPCDVDPEAEFLGDVRETSYWFLTFEDGFEVDSIGGVHLEFLDEVNDV